MQLWNQNLTNAFISPEWSVTRCDTMGIVWQANSAAETVPTGTADGVPTGDATSVLEGAVEWLILFPLQPLNSVVSLPLSHMPAGNRFNFLQFLLWEKTWQRLCYSLGLYGGRRVRGPRRSTLPKALLKFWIFIHGLLLACRLRENPQTGEVVRVEMRVVSCVSGIRFCCKYLKHIYVDAED